MPVRIYDIAKKLGIESKEVLAKAKALGISAAKVPSSSLDKITAEYLENELGGIPPAAVTSGPVLAPEPVLIVAHPPPPAPPPTPIVVVQSPEPAPAPAEELPANPLEVAPPEMIEVVTLPPAPPPVVEPRIEAQEIVEVKPEPELPLAEETA